MAKERECIKWLAHTFLALHIDLLWGLTCIILPACASFLLLFPHTPLSDRLVLLYVWLWASTSRPVWLWPLCKEPTWTKFFFQFINVPMSEIRITTVIPNPFLGLWPHSDITNFWRHFSSCHLGSHVTAAVPAQIFSYADLIWTWLMFMKVGRLKKKNFLEVSVLLNMLLLFSAERLHSTGRLHSWGVQHVSEQHLPSLGAGPHLLWCVRTSPEVLFGLK